MDSLSMNRTAAAAFICPWSFISCTVPFGTCNNMEQLGSLFGAGFPFFQQGHGQEIPVQDEQGIPEMFRCTEAVTEHLYDMGNRFIPKPFTDDTVPVMDLDRQGKAERF